MKSLNIFFRTTSDFLPQSCSLKQTTNQNDSRISNKKIKQNVYSYSLVKIKRNSVQKILGKSVLKNMSVDLGTCSEMADIFMCKLAVFILIQWSVNVINLWLLVSTMYSVLVCEWLCFNSKLSLFFWYMRYFSVMVFNATFNSILAISWRSVLLIEEARISWENHRPVASHWQILSHNVVSSKHCHEWDSYSQL